VSASEKTKKLLEQWSLKSGRTYEDLLSEFQRHFDRLKETLPGKTFDFYENRARFLVYRGIKTRMYARGESFDAIFFGYSDLIDVTAKQRAYAIQMFKTNPEKAIREGYTDVNGTPLDTREFLPTGAKNPFYGKPLREVFVRQAVGIGRPARGGDLKMITLTMLMDQARNLPPLGKPVRFLGRLVTQDEFRYQINTVRATTYDPSKIKDFPSVDEQTICNILLRAPNEFRVSLADLQEWHEKHADDIRRVCIVEADVVFVRREPTTIGNYIMIVEDETLMDLEVEGITVWVHKALEHQLSFAAGSRVIIVGRTVMGPSWDPETRRINPEIQRLMINAFGIWCIPEYRIPLEEERVLEPTEEV